MDKKPAWEPIDEKHKTGDLIVVMHERSPDDAACVRWVGHQWVGTYIEDFGTLTYSDADVILDFTHAYVLPALPNARPKPDDA